MSKAKISNRSARDQYGLAVMCPASRHAEQIAEELIEHGSCGQLADEGKRAGQSILSAVRSLYAARAEIARLTAEAERHRMTPAERGVLNEVADLLEESWGRPSSVSKEIRSLLDRTAQKEVGRE